MTQSDHRSRAHAPALVELRRVLTDTPSHLLQGDFAHPEQPLRRVARALADDARARDDVRAELLLIELRHLWRELPEARRLEPRTHEELWDRLVTACIEEFYRR